MNLVPTAFIENVASLLGEYYFGKLTMIDGHFGHSVARFQEQCIWFCIPGRKFEDRDFRPDVKNLRGELLTEYQLKNCLRIEITAGYGDHEMSKEMMDQINRLQRYARHVDLWLSSTVSPSLIDFIGQLRVTEITALNRTSNEWAIVTKCVERNILERAFLRYASDAFVVDLLLQPQFKRITVEYCCYGCRSDSIRRLSAFLNENMDAVRGKTITICDMDERCFENLQKLLISAYIDADYKDEEGQLVLRVYIYC
ncbi:hypothetical protein QR680_014875 [Steinernema hermaphroditum]|uniref:Uncharacterized protein n=1 Tax=Steinernema hermaphroditum TaxID=289476 RepID=A0AA39M503_9BILA|nr:hypothetical protein QR680_014875 [Steinernema hermaphroditum]